MAERPPIHLNVVDVARAAKLAFEQGRLSAQGQAPKCAYRDTLGNPCAVGAALNDDDAWRLERAEFGGGQAGAGVADLIRAGWLTTDDEDGLLDIQLAHDAWVGGCGSGAAFMAAVNSVLEREAAQ